MKMAGVLEQGWIYILWEGGSPEAGLNISDLEEQDILSFTTSYCFTVLHFSLFYCTFYFLFLFFTYIYYALVWCHFYISFFYFFYSLHCPLSGPDLTYISLLIIPCIIYHVTNKETLTLNLDLTLPFFHIFSILAANSVVAQNHLSFLQMHIWSIWWIESLFVSSLYFILLCVHKIHISLSEMHTNTQFEHTSHLKNMIFFR